jgi:hypothetical protein
MKKRNPALKRIMAVVAAMVIILSSIATSLISINKASAINANESEPADAITALDAKIRANTLYYCLMNTPVESDETINSYSDDMLRYGIEFIFDTDSDIWDDDGSVIVPFSFGTTYIKDGELKCEEAFSGYSGSGQTFQSATSDSKIHNLTSDQALIDMMSALGYTYTMDTSSVTDQGCFYIEINTNASPVDGNTYISDGTASTNNVSNSSYRGRTNEVCFDLDADGKIVDAHDQGGAKTYSNFNYGYKAWTGPFSRGSKSDSSTALLRFSVDYSYIAPYVDYSGNFSGGSLYDSSADDGSGSSSALSWYEGENTTWTTAKTYATQLASSIMASTAWPSTQRGWYEQCRESNSDGYLIYFDSNTVDSQCLLQNFFTGVSAKITEPSSDTGGIRVWTRPYPVNFNDNLQYFVGSKATDNAYTDDDAYVMYYTLLKDVYNMTFNAGSNLPECQNTAPAADNLSIPVKVRSTGQIVYCGGVVKTSDDAKVGAKGTAEKSGKFSKDGKVNAIESVGGNTLAHMGGDELLAKLNALDISKVTDEHIVMIDDCSENPDAPGCSGGGSDGSTTETPEAEEDECDPSIEANTKDVKCQEKGCYKEAGSMGWIICPVIFGIHGFVDNIYNKAIAPLLAVDEGIVYDLGQMNDKSATYKAWALFRNIANILFAIVLLVVVFSQVTGFGIDNYGVKKILPKLIVTAILVNLSFIICGLLVDISNMLGAGLKGLFENAAGTVTIAGIQSDSAKMTGIIVEGILILLAGGGMAAGAMAFASGAITGWSIVLPLLLILLAAVITVICAVIVLGARQAIILILIVVSPFAFVCYALPNLNGLFKKWLKLFEAMLLVFPICGALVGGGYFASCIMLGANSDGSILMLIMSAIVCMVPYFLIPSVTSRAMNAIGGLAGRVMGMGRGVSNGIGNRARNSEAYKNRIKNSQDAARARAANRYLNSRRGRRDLATVEGGGTLNRHRSARLSNALKNANSNYALNKDILDESQNRRDIASGSMAAVDAYKRDQGHLDLDDKAAHIGALTQAAEMERMDANNTRAFADNNDSAAIEAEAIALAGAGLGDAANLSRYNAAMNRLAKIDPSAYRRAIDGSIAAGNHDVATRQAIKDNAIANSDVAKEQGLKDLLKANVTPTANNPTGQLSTANDYTKAQAGKSVKDMLALDDDYIADIANGNIQTDANIQETARMALQSMAANPKMAEDKKAEYLNNLVRIATNGTQSNYADYQANQAAIANQDLISVDLTGGGQLSIDRRDIPNGDAKQIDPSRSRQIAPDEIQIVFKDGSEYNTRTKTFTPSHNPGPGGNP